MATSGEGGEFLPVHEAHAIEQLLIGVQFDRPLDDASMRAGSEAMGRFTEALPGRNDIMGMGFQIGPQGVIPIAPAISGVPNGVQRTLSDRRGMVVKELRLERQSLAFRTLAYSRWDAVWAEARDYFAGVLPVLGGANLAAYALTYHDKFVWTGAPETCRPVTLLKQGSPYISPVILNSTDLWHCHSGQFLAPGGSVKRLRAINLDCVDEAEGSEQPPKIARVVRITTSVTDFLNQPGFAHTEVPLAGSIDYLHNALTNLHVSLKDVFSEIVSEDAAKKVGLNANAD